MKKNTYNNFYLTKIGKAFSILLFFTFACTTNVTTISDIGLKDNKYDIDYYQLTKAAGLDKLINSVKMINCIAYYESYLLKPNSKIRKGSISKTNIEVHAINKITSNETSSGTATIIYSHNGKAALITCAHILDFPDTLITFFKDSNGYDTEFVESLSIKVRQTNLLPELAVANEVEILAINREADIAIVGKDVSALNANKYLPFDYKTGNSNELSWGTKVYIIGYPLNNKMITSGLVSPPPSPGKDYFFVDAVFNRGFSGGVVLAIRDGAPNFELVGMVRSGTVHRNYVLRPNSNNPDFVYLPKIPYESEVIVEQQTDIKYGVTKIMTIETILDFVRKQKNALKELGYDTKKFW